MRETSLLGQDTGTPSSLRHHAEHSTALTKVDLQTKDSSGPKRSRLERFHNTYTYISWANGLNLSLGQQLQLLHLGWGRVLYACTPLRTEDYKRLQL